MQPNIKLEKSPGVIELKYDRKACIFDNMRFFRNFEIVHHRKAMFIRSKLKYAKSLKTLLNNGLSLKRISLCIAVGITLGIFPVLGSTSALCAFAALALRLNLPAIQAVNFMVYPLQIILLTPSQTSIVLLR